MKVFDKVEGRRLLNELIHMLNEKNPVPSLTLMSVHGIPQALHPALDFNTKARELVEAAATVLVWWKYLFLKDKLDAWIVYFFALTDTLTDEEFLDIMKRFSRRISRERSPERAD